VSANNAAGTAVFTNTAYSFSITGDTTLYAVFTKYTVTPTAGADTYYNNFATALSNAATGSTITLYADASVTSTQTISNKAITLQSNSATARTITDSVTGKMFDLGSGATLTLGAGITLDGEDYSNSIYPLVFVDSGATLVMNTGSTITRGNTSGGGVQAAGRVNMNGGAITANTTTGSLHYGGGVLIGGGLFTMSGSAEISNNTSSNNSSGGGVGIIGSGSQFIMSGGTISGNKVPNGEGGGVYIENGTFAITDSAIWPTCIDNNTASGNGQKVYKGINGVFIIGNNPTDYATGGSGGDGIGTSGNIRYWD
jgi:hypothetical protein